METTILMVSRIFYIYNYEMYINRVMDYLLVYFLIYLTKNLLRRKNEDSEIKVEQIHNKMVFIVSILTLLFM